MSEKAEKWCKLLNTLKNHGAVGKGSNAQKIRRDVREMCK